MRGRDIKTMTFKEYFAFKLFCFGHVNNFKLYTYVRKKKIRLGKENKRTNVIFYVPVVVCFMSILSKFLMQYHYAMQVEKMQIAKIKTLPEINWSNYNQTIIRL